ncbi:MAG: hypothetical protein D6753_06800 [Planctomycetota bacterium]|nr:MAG: hypothetical protein D6753_06800 [Planctomycetota bacterium]
MPVSPVQSEADFSVCPETALVNRCLHASPRARRFLRWLAKPTATQSRLYSQSLQGGDAALCGLVERLLQGILIVEEGPSAPPTCEPPRPEGRVLASALCDLHMLSGAADLSNSAQWLVTTCLPLYRAAVEGDVESALVVTRYRLAEWWCMLVLCSEIGEPLSAILDADVSPARSPHQVLQEKLGLNLEAIAQTVLEFVWEFDEHSDRLAVDAQSRLAAMTKEEMQARVASSEPWQQPAELWKTAAALDASNQTALLPRTWIDVPIPWEDASGHLRELRSRLASLQGDAKAFDLLPRSIADPRGASNGSSRGAEPPQHPWLLALQGEGASGSPAARHPTNLPTGSDITGEAPWLPRMLIAEMHSVHDPMLQRSLARLLALAESEGAPLSFLIVDIEPLDDRARSRLEGNGNSPIKSWQQRLADALYDAAEHHLPRAYLTSAGELAICLLGVSRTRCSQLLREQLRECLAGEMRGTRLEATLDARYRAGIAGVEPPVGTITPDRVIESAVRCFRAATHQSTSSVKGIDVF